MTLVSFGLMVLSSVVAAWNDIAKVLLGPTAEQLLPDLVDANKGTGNSTAGYLWMMINCIVSAGYVLGMRKRIKVTNFKVDISMYTRSHEVRLMTSSGLGLDVLQQSAIHPRLSAVLGRLRDLVRGKPQPELVSH